MRKLVLFASIAALLAVLSGCGGSGLGPVTAGNIINDYPPKVRGVVVNAEASMIVVDFQPYDGRVTVEGWFFDPDNGGRRSIRTQRDVIDGSGRGRVVFVLDPAIRAGVKHFFKIRVEEVGVDDPRQSAPQVWQYFDGHLARIA